MIVLSAIGIGIFEIVGSFGAAHDNDTGRKGMDALAIALICSARWPWRSATAGRSASPP